MGNTTAVIATRANLKAEAKGKRIILVDTAAGKLQMKEHTVIREHVDQVNCVAMSPKGILASSGNDGEIMLFDTRQQKPLALRSDETNLVNALCFSPTDEGRHLITASVDKSVRIFNISDFSHREELQTVQQQANAKSKKLCKLLGHIGPVNCMTYSSNGQYLATGSNDDSVILWDMPTVMKTKERKIMHTLRHPGPIFAVAFSADCRRVFTACKDKFIRCYVVESGRPFWDNPIQLPPPSVASMKTTVVAAPHPSIPLTLSTSPDGTMLACGCQDRTVLIFDIATNSHEPVLKFPPLLGHTQPVRSVSFSNNSSFLVTGSEDATIRVWKVLNGEENDEGKPSVTLIAGPILAGTERVNSVAWSPDNNFVVTASYDATVRVFTFECPGVEVGKFDADREISRVEFSEDGNMIRARDKEGSLIKSWYVSPRAEKRVLAKAALLSGSKKKKVGDENQKKPAEKEAAAEDDDDAGYESTDSEEEARLEAEEAARRNNRIFTAAGMIGDGFVGQELREEASRGYPEIGALDNTMTRDQRRKKELDQEVANQFDWGEDEDEDE